MKITAIPTATTAPDLIFGLKSSCSVARHSGEAAERRTPLGSVEGSWHSR